MTQKSRKIRAIAAGGAVLGLGAAITLAAWSDSEFATGTFITGSFDIQSATDGATFASTDAGTPLQLTFTGADNLAPDVPVYNAYQLQNAGSVDAYINYTGVPATGVAESLEVEFRSIAGATCDADIFAAGTVIAPAEEFELSTEVPRGTTVSALRCRKATPRRPLRSARLSGPSRPTRTLRQ